MKTINLNLMLFTLVTLCLMQGCSGGSNDSKLDPNAESQEAQQFFELLENSNSKVEDGQGNEISAKQISVERTWNGNICKISLKNTSNEVLYPKDVILFNIPKHGLNPDSPVYGEGFQMLHQNGGTLRTRENIGGNPDNKHYKIPDLHGLPTAYGLLNVNIKEDENLLLGFTSCKRFIGRISYDSLQMLVSVDTEGLKLEPGESWELEDFMLIAGKTQGELYDQLAIEINRNQAPRRTSTIPIGWCSWYCYRMDITDDIMKENMDAFAQKVPELEYIQLDDGYQQFMGDWLDPNPAYGDVRNTIDAIREKGFEPAIWVAPFIAQKESRVFKEHPDWFVKNSDGEPLNSATVAFGGWRYGPWYCLDGTHPEVQSHFKNIFRVMREEWGVNYFKLDANYWGAIQEGIHFVENSSRIEAYRQGMEAVLSGCDDNTVVLGCNAPIWPSIGLVTAQRTSGDIRRRWNSFKSLAKQNLSRCWQNGKLWDSDPDCIVLAKDGVFGVNDDVTENEWMFHATSIHAVGGLILSGDKAENLNEKELAILKKLLEPTGKGASFVNTKMETGITDLGDKQYYYFFNWGEETIDLSVQLKTKSRLMDFWTDEDLGVHEGIYSVKSLAPHSAQLILAREV
jgi:alpha-galactosidase